MELTEYVDLLALEDSPVMYIAALLAEEDDSHRVDADLAELGNLLSHTWDDGYDQGYAWAIAHPLP